MELYSDCFSRSWPGVLKKDPTVGWMELDHPLSILWPNLTSLLVDLLICLSGNAPNVRGGFIDKVYRN